MLDKKAMNTNRMTIAVLLVGALLAGVLPSAAAGSNAKTAQGVFVDLKAAGDFAIVDTNTYKFNVDEAATYFTNLWDGNSPTVTCTGPGCSTAPAAPPAPAPDVSKLTGPNGVCEDQKCTFLDGGTLTGNQYTQTAMVSTGSGKTGATYTYTYTYLITPTGDGTVTPLTAWVLVGSSGPTTAHITINANIAGESVLVSSQFPAPGKFSFSLTDPTDGNRVTNLNVVVTDANNNVIASATPGSAISTNCPGCLAGDLGAVDFTYSTNAGSNGVIQYLKDGDARTILNTDVFGGNNNGGSDGSALAIANMDPVGVDLAPGTYTVTFTGVVKGVNSLQDIPFDITQKINIVTPGCSSQ